MCDSGIHNGCDKWKYSNSPHLFDQRRGLPNQITAGTECRAIGRKWNIRMASPCLACEVAFCLRPITVIGDSYTVHFGGHVLK